VCSLSDLDIVLGKRERAIQILLDTPTDAPQYYQEALKACVVAAAISPTHFQDTVRSRRSYGSVYVCACGCSCAAFMSHLTFAQVKIVATNLIAKGSLNEGVQLLCLVISLSSISVFAVS
jgi:hypothetical protein